MNNTLTLTSFAGLAVLLVGVGLLINRVGDIGIRTDNSSPSMSLNVSAPLMVGVPFAARWEVQDPLNNNRLVELQLVTSAATVPLGQSMLGAMQANGIIPCIADIHEARLELRDAVNHALFASQGVTLLSPGPDCLQ